MLDFYIEILKNAIYFLFLVVFQFKVAMKNMIYNCMHMYHKPT